jgi:hypothetical protein
MVNFVPLPDVVVDESVEWSEAQPSPLDVVAGRFGMLLPRTMVPGMARILAALLPDLFTTENAARQAGLSSRAETADKGSHAADSAREYDAPWIGFRRVALKIAGSRYSVPALVPLNPNGQPKMAIEEVTSTGLQVAHELPRKWREKLKSNAEIGEVFGLRDLPDGSFQVWP